MNKEEIEDILEELHLVRPEILKPKAKKLFEAIMSIADERDELQQENQELKKQYCERTDCSGRLGNSKKVEQLIKENQELKNQLEKYENPEDMTLMMMWTTEKVKDENKELKERIDKAIEYINKKAIKKEIQETRNIVNIIYSLKLNNYEFIELEDILKGDKE